MGKKSNHGYRRTSLQKGTSALVQHFPNLVVASESSESDNLAKSPSPTNYIRCASAPGRFQVSASFSLLEKQLNVINRGSIRDDLQDFIAEALVVFPFFGDRLLECANQEHCVEHLDGLLELCGLWDRAHTVFQGAVNCFHALQKQNEKLELEIDASRCMAGASEQKTRVQAERLNSLQAEAHGMNARMRQMVSEHSRERERYQREASQREEELKAEIARLKADNVRLIRNSAKCNVASVDENAPQSPQKQNGSMQHHVPFSEQEHNENDESAGENASRLPSRSPLSIDAFFFTPEGLIQSVEVDHMSGNVSPSRTSSENSESHDGDDDDISAQASPVTPGHRRIMEKVRCAYEKSVAAEFHANRYSTNRNDLSAAELHLHPKDLQALQGSMESLSEQLHGLREQEHEQKALMKRMDKLFSDCLTEASSKTSKVEQFQASLSRAKQVAQERLQVAQALATAKRPSLGSVGARSKLVRSIKTIGMLASLSASKPRLKESKSSSSATSPVSRTPTSRHLPAPVPSPSPHIPRAPSSSSGSEEPLSRQSRRTSFADELEASKNNSGKPETGICQDPLKTSTTILSSQKHEAGLEIGTAGADEDGRSFSDSSSVSSF
mmetsp:Transcript_4744/g.7380  ORF Transcript_4744/g.7380 Transcript_4744/m.7380 type:complete len:613 (+) Transcript_4744:303-2141(+)